MKKGKQLGIENVNENKKGDREILKGKEKSRKMEN